MNCIFVSGEWTILAPFQSALLATVGQILLRKAYLARWVTRPWVRFSSPPRLSES